MIYFLFLLAVSIAQAEEALPPDSVAREQILEDDPDNASNVYSLALLYIAKGEFQRALELSEKRLAMGGSEEEIYHSLYLIGTIQESLEMPSDLISNSYCRAFVYSPDRAEPIFRLIQYLNKKQNFPLSYALAKLALGISLPKEGIEIENWVYEYGILSEFAISAFSLGKIEESRQAYHQLLAKSLPETLKRSIEQNLDQAQLFSSSGSEEKRAEEIEDGVEQQSGSQCPEK